MHKMPLTASETIEWIQELIDIEFKIEREKVRRKCFPNALKAEYLQIFERDGSVRKMTYAEMKNYHKELHEMKKKLRLKNGDLVYDLE